MDNFAFNFIVIILFTGVIILILSLKRDVKRLTDTITKNEKIDLNLELQCIDIDNEVIIENFDRNKITNDCCTQVCEDIYTHDYDDIFAETCKNNNTGKYFLIISHEDDDNAKMITPDGSIKLLELKLFNSFEDRDLVEIFDDSLITKKQLFRYINYIEIDANNYMEEYERQEKNKEKSSIEPEYIRSYRAMLKNPDTFPSRMLKCISDNVEITSYKLKEMLNEKYGYRADTSGSFSASLRVLLVDEYVNIDGIGDRKKIMIKKN